MKKLALLVLALALAACRHEVSCLGDTRSGSIDNARIDTLYDSSHKALFHIYVIPDWKPQPAFGSGDSAAIGGTAEKQTIRHAFREEHFTVPAEPVSFTDCTFVNAGHHVYDIARGNVFVANVHRDGTLQVKQLKHRLEDRNPSPEEVVAFIRRENG